jgi:hypothetical protein
MSARILDAALREVYSGAHLSVDVVEEQGTAGYAASIAAAKRLPRVGGNPLVLRAVGAAASASPVLSLEDARRFLGSAGVAAIFKKAAVVIVIGTANAPASTGAPASQLGSEAHP